jgi:hypothetical protein
VAAAKGDIEIADPGNGNAIPVTDSGWCPLVSGAGAETRTIADPTSAGMRIRLFMDTDGGGNIAVTAASAIDSVPGNTVMTFGDAGDYITLFSISLGAAFAWRYDAPNGVALT